MGEDGGAVVQLEGVGDASGAGGAGCGEEVAGVEGGWEGGCRRVGVLGSISMVSSCSGLSLCFSSLPWLLLLQLFLMLPFGSMTDR